jgi:hypothetical protein
MESYEFGWFASGGGRTKVRACAGPGLVISQLMRQRGFSVKPRQFVTAISAFMEAGFAQIL